MTEMPDYLFYKGEYGGNSISDECFLRISKRAEAQLNRYRRIYTVTGDDKAEKMAVCAMADALYFYENAENGGTVISSSIGSVSSSKQEIDMSEKAQAAELYRCASLYLDIYRGCGR